MNSAVTQNVVEAPRQLLLDALRIAPWNARKTFDKDALHELAASIQEQGLIAPLIVRPINGGKYEIVAGHRRFHATLHIGWNDVPCFVRDLTEDQARELGLVDNVQREDVPALEEADGYKELQQRLGTPAAIAARVGKEVSYVTKRLQLVSLGDFPRKALAERLITVDHALLLARLGPVEQDANLKWALNPNSGIKEQVQDTIAQRIKARDRRAGYSGYWEPQSVLDLRHHIEKNVGRKLSHAPWSLEDAELVPAAGACSTCPSNTKANDMLFGDLSIAAATCEDGSCFEQKRETFVRIRLSKASIDLERMRPELSAAIKLSWKTTTVKPRVAKGELLNADGFNSTQVFKYGQWIDAKKGSCEFIRLGVAVDWFDPGYYDKKKARKPGEIITVCIAEKCKVHKKGYDQPARKANGRGYDPKADEEKREQKKQAAIAESKIRMAAASAAIEQVRDLPVDALRALLIGHCVPYNRRAYEALMPGLVKAIKEDLFLSVEFARAIAILSIDELQASEYSDAKEGRGDFLASLKRLGYDGAGAWVQAKAETKAAAVKKPTPEKKSILSPAAKKRIADAQRKRWANAKVKKGSK